MMLKWWVEANRRGVQLSTWVAKQAENIVYPQQEWYENYNVVQEGWIQGEALLSQHRASKADPLRCKALLTKHPLSADLYRSCTVSLPPSQTAFPTCGHFRLLSKYQHVFG